MDKTKAKITGFCRVCGAKCLPGCLSCSSECKRKYADQKLWHFEPLDDIKHQIFEGIMLSDGNLEIQETANYPRFRLSQSRIHEDYAIFFQKFFGLGDDRIYRDTFVEKPTGKIRERTVFSTLTSPCFMPYFKRWYPDGETKIIPPDFKVTPYSLLHEFLGDGCCSKDRAWYQLSMIVTSYSWESINDILMKQLKSIGLNLRTYQMQSNNNKIIKTGRHDLIHRFFDYIPACPVKCYHYKWPENYECRKKLV